MKKIKFKPTTLQNRIIIKHELKDYLIPTAILGTIIISYLVGRHAGKK